MYHLHTRLTSNLVISTRGCIPVFCCRIYVAILQFHLSLATYLPGSIATPQIRTHVPIHSSGSIGLLSRDRSSLQDQFRQRCHHPRLTPYIDPNTVSEHVSILIMLPPNFLCGAPASEIETAEIGKPRDLEISRAGKLCPFVIY